MTKGFDYVNISVGKNLFGDVTELYQGATSISNAVVGSGCNYGFGGGAFKLAYTNKNDWDVQSLLFKPYW